MTENPGSEQTPDAERRRREREWLLPRIEPSEFNLRPAEGVFTEPSGLSGLTDDLARGFEPEEPTT